MGEWRMEDLPLPALFEQGLKIHNMASESSVDLDTLKKGCEALQQCEEMISKLGLFSANETKDDISTTNLKYSLVPFYLGELMEKVAHKDRIQLLKISQAKLKEFISFCEAMELIPDEELQTSAQEGPASLTDHRALKIARFKRQRAAELKLQEIKERRERRGRSSKAAALSTPIEAGEEDLLDDDGEEEREAWLTAISLALCKAFDLLEMLKKEEEMLSAVKEKQLQEGDKEIDCDILDERTKRAEAWHRDAAVRAQFTRPAQPITCATFAQDVIEGRAMVSQAHEHKHQPLLFGPASLVGGRLTSERERMAAQVFQPGHRLPTMSIEEAGLREMEMMNKWQEMNARLMEEANNSSWHQEGRKPGPNNEEDEDDDAAVDKARAWDDWKDDHPRGAGNKKLTPCG
ncbi:PP2A regulatory subunit TAP46-like isoform X1 [Telopea speciosissima]|uniref:PP2A regulatory subunit TAP46-like isoform X1 n=1 Tax=Telopea speciosissima TaxID=54955 RepID=UPI001CC73BD1|nr:PP2A regulatory subunit TAP46-like isoform X1 [Telopea speciosissima]